MKFYSRFVLDQFDPPNEAQAVKTHPHTRNSSDDDTTTCCQQEQGREVSLLREENWQLKEDPLLLGMWLSPTECLNSIYKIVCS